MLYRWIETWDELVISFDAKKRNSSFRSMAKMTFRLKSDDMAVRKKKNISSSSRRTLLNLLEKENQEMMMNISQSSSSSSTTTMAVKKLFDSHCHLQDPRIYRFAPQLIRTALQSGVLHFAVNGVSEKDWDVVKQMSEEYPSSVLPNFGLHPWFIVDRTPTWFNTLKEFIDATPSAAVGEIGLDKGSRGKQIDFTDQVQVFRQQLELARELGKPASIHCVRAFGDLLEIMQSTGPFPVGVILHSYLGSAEMVPALAKLGAYFSFSGFLMSMKPQKAKKMLKSVPKERILLESDSPDALPTTNLDSASLVQWDDSVSFPKETLNHPANVHCVLSYVASLLEIPEAELAELSYRNALRVFSYPGSKIIVD